MAFDRYKAILCDLDGCLISGDTCLPGAAELVSRTGDRLYVVSNNSTDTPQTLSDRLARLGLVVPPGRILLAGVVAIGHIAARSPGCRVSIYGTGPIVALARQAGLTVTDEAPDIVLLTRDVTFSYGRLSRLLHQLDDGAELIVANMDLTHPGADGVPVPETGALLQSIRACMPDLCFTAIGKPEPDLMEAAMKRAGAHPNECLYIGDNPATDGEGARRLGLPFALVLTGDGHNGLSDLLRRQPATE